MKQIAVIVLCIIVAGCASAPAWGQDFSPIRINAAGGNYTDSQGSAWGADSGFSGGLTARSAKPIANAVDVVLYQSERWGQFSYAFTVPAGTYAVTLRFAETWFAASGQRLFHVAINGETVLADFDIAAAAGGANIAVDRTFEVVAPRGTDNLRIQFIHMGGQPDNPKVNAIEIIDAGVVAPPTPAPLVITSQPADQTVIAGQSATFSVTAAGEPPLSYQWRQNGTNISGASAPSYSTPPTTATDSGAQFSVVVGNSAGSLTSAAATLTVSPAAACSQDIGLSWTNSSLPAQGTLFMAAFDATPSEANMDGVVGFSSSAANDYTGLAAIARFANTGVIEVRNGGAYTADVYVPYVAGSSYRFRFAVDLSTRRYDVYVSGPGRPEVALATGYAFRSEQSAASTLNNWNAVTTSGTVTICNMVVSGSSVPPFITLQPVSQTVVAGQSATFSVAAAGTAPIFYQWRKNGAIIDGAAASLYTTPAATAADSGAQFSVVVSNVSGSAVSSNATLTVGAPTHLLSANPSTLNFGSISIGEIGRRSSILTNTGNSNVTIGNVSLSGAGLTVSGVSTGEILQPGQSVAVNVNFLPALLGALTGGVVITSDATNSPITISLSGLGVQLVSRSAILNWMPSTSSVTGYHVYSGSVSDGPYTKLTGAPVTDTTYEDSSVEPGRTYHYVVTAVNSGGVESPFSNQASAVIP